MGLTSVGSGSIIIICLMLLYPMLRGAELVGTDLVQAIPLVAAAALAHILVGDFELALTASILIGVDPGGLVRCAAVVEGARRRHPARCWCSCSLASALKLLDVPTNTARACVLLLFALVGLAVWGAFDAAQHPKTQWEAIGLDKRSWVSGSSTSRRSGSARLTRWRTSRGSGRCSDRRRRRSRRDRAGGEAMFERIVVAVDGSRQGGKTLPVAVEMAERSARR